MRFRVIYGITKNTHGGKIMKALFGRKIFNSNELKEFTEKAKKEGSKGTECEVTKEIELSDEEFKEFAKDFCREQPWITKEDGGYNENGELRCIRVKNSKSRKSILVDSEGYTYPRYTAIEK